MSILIYCTFFDIIFPIYNQLLYALNHTNCTNTEDQKDKKQIILILKTNITKQNKAMVEGGSQDKTKLNIREFSV